MDTKQASEEYEKQLKLFKYNQYKYPLRLIFQKRAFHTFCVGTPKSGTHSIANMFRGFRTSHEPNEVFMINLINKVKNKTISPRELETILITKDRFNWLEMESSHYNGYFVEELSNSFKHTKFILTIRDCLSWVDSWFNHQLSRRRLTDSSIYDVGRANYYARGFPYTKHDKFLEDLKLYPIKSYLTFWREHNQRVLNSVTKDKLLVLKTHSISTSSTEIAQFLNINKIKINNQDSHEFKAKAKHGILSKLDANFLYDTAMELCADINDKYFPEKTIQETLRNITSGSV